MSGGYNPLRWDCDTRGCFNQFCRPKIERFATCFPGNIAMSDIDATVEVNGRFLFLEMKSHQGRIPVGQRIYLERLTRLSSQIVAMIVCGDAQTMQCQAICWVYGGQVFDWQPATLDDVTQLLEDFTQWATGREIAA